MATYLVTGGCGFIGSHLCNALITRGETVRVLDDLSTGSRNRLPANVGLVQGDVADLPAVRKAMSGVDGCFHLAAIASVELAKCHWLRSHKTNLTGALTVFQAAMEVGPVPVVYASSAAVYGECAKLPIRESSDKLPLSAYGADKFGCELHAQAARQVLRSVGLRLFNVYGPGQNPKSLYSGVISIFCDRLQHGEPIEVFGDGRQTRDFIFVADVVTAVLRAMDAQLSDAPVFNICTGRAVSVLELAQTVASLCGQDLSIHFRPARNGEIKHSYGDPTVATETLGLPDPTELKVGLAATLAWLRGMSDVQKKC
jgi:UDP-glucose 4-epimerase